jgi:NAD(P)-dependent dehydrogenase (short-subunit alcohol dehydrogenase family)
MQWNGHKIVITAAGRDFGRSLALTFAQLGAEVYLSARTLTAAESVREEITALGDGAAHAFACDLTDAASIRGFAHQVDQHTEQIDVLINNGARYLDGEALLSGTDDEVADTIASAATGAILATRAFLPLLLKSPRPDIITMISSAGILGHARSHAHDAFYAAKAAQAGFTEILSKRLRPHGVRVISLYPPDFDNPDPLSPDWHAPRTAQDPLSAGSLVQCILFAISQPRDCFIKAFHFEEPA